MRRRLDPNLSHAEIRARILGGNAKFSRDRTRMIASGNPDVLREAADVDQPEPRLRLGPAYQEGKNARPVEHHGGKMDTKDIGRRRVISY
jgi:hypothetical protein